jgi:hypothetical protein
MAKLVFQLGHAVVEALQNFSCGGGKFHAVCAMMARGGTALDGIFIFFAAGEAGALAQAGSEWGGHLGIYSFIAKQTNYTKVFFGDSGARPSPGAAM